MTQEEDFQHGDLIEVVGTGKSFYRVLSVFQGDGNSTTSLDMEMLDQPSLQGTGRITFSLPMAMLIALVDCHGAVHYKPKKKEQAGVKYED